MTRSRTDRALEQRAVSPEQELELINYTKGLTERYPPPTRTMIKNFASEIAKKEVSVSWVTRFMNRNRDQLTSQWSAVMGSISDGAGSSGKHELYSEMMERKIAEHGIESKHTYCMDEKGIAVGDVGNKKVMFNKKLYETKKSSEHSLQEGKREWVTMVACACADGSTLPPGLICQKDKKNTQSAWLSEAEARKNSTFFFTSPSGWMDDDIGLTWLEQVFNRYNKQKDQGRPRLLVVDGHGSHLTIDFISVQSKQYRASCLSSLDSSASVTGSNVF